MYNRGCRCEVCRKAGTARQALVRERRKGKVPNEHGLSAYTNWGCRCDVCSAAARARNREIRQRAQRGEIVHVRGGVVANCSCQHCRGVANARAKYKNTASLESAKRHRYEWTGPELEMVSRDDLTASELAEGLGRTVAAVQAMRKRLAAGDIKMHRLLGKHMHGGRY